MVTVFLAVLFLVPSYGLRVFLLPIFCALDATLFAKPLADVKPVVWKQSFALVARAQNLFAFSSDNGILATEDLDVKHRQIVGRLKNVAMKPILKRFGVGLSF